MHMECNDPLNLHVDNKSVIDLAKHPIAHGKSKHINIKYHFIRDQMNKKKINVQYYNTKDQIVYILTKPLKVERFVKPKKMLGMQSLDNLN